MEEMFEEMRDMEALLGRYRPAAAGASEGGLRSRVVRSAREQSRGAFWEGMGALLLVGMALGQVAGSVTRLVPARRVEEGRVEQIAAALKEAGVPLGEEERAVMAAKWAAGERLVRVPLVRGTGMSSRQMGGMQ